MVKISFPQNGNSAVIEGGAAGEAGAPVGWSASDLAEGVAELERRPGFHCDTQLGCRLPAWPFLLPWLDTFVVGNEPVLKAPEDGVGAVGHADAAVAAADDCLDGVD